MPRFTVRDFGTALNFNSGSSQFAQLKASKILSDQANVSLAMWVRISKTPPSASIVPALYCERAAAGNDIWKLEVINGTKALRFTHRNDANTLTQITNATGKPVVDGSWHMVGLTKSGTTVNLYVDGVVDKTGTLNGTDTLTDASQVVCIGKDVRDANAYLHGLADEVWLFTRTLSTDEMQDLYYQGTTDSLANCVGHYKFDEGSGTAVVDSAAVQANGSITGATYTTDVVMKPRSLAA